MCKIGSALHYIEHRRFPSKSRRLSRHLILHTICGIRVEILAAIYLPTFSANTSFLLPWKNTSSSALACRFLLCFRGLMQKLSDVQAKKVEAAVVEARNGVCSPLVRLLSACVCLECETDWIIQPNLPSKMWRVKNSHWTKNRSKDRFYWFQTIILPLMMSVYLKKNIWFLESLAHL